MSDTDSDRRGEYLGSGQPTLDEETLSAPPAADEPQEPPHTDEPPDAAEPPFADAADHETSTALRDAFVSWVSEHLAKLEPKDDCWCPEWWKHPEAVARLHACWMAWEETNEPVVALSAVSSWWVYHWDHHAPYLFNRTEGPFRDCDVQRGHLVNARSSRPQLAVSEPPADWRP